MDPVSETSFVHVQADFHFSAVTDYGRGDADNTAPLRRARAVRQPLCLQMGTVLDEYRRGQAEASSSAHVGSVVAQSAAFRQSRPLPPPPPPRPSGP